MTVTLPAEMTYGRVVGRWILAVADTPNDPDDLPEAQIPAGTVSFTRINTYSVRPDTTQADGTYVGILKQNVSTTLGSDGELRLSPTAPPGVWLVTGFYKVNATISGMQWPSFDIEVTTEHTQENPLDLIHVTPIVVSPTTVLVPSYETKDSAEAAAASAEQSAIDAAQSAQSASSSAVSAAGSAASIADALPMMENLVDYNWIGSGSPYGVLTPARVGIEYTDTAQTNGARKWISTGTTSTSWEVINGDTGWRNISSTLVNGWTGTVLVRRVNRDVHWAFYGVNGTSATAQDFIPSPAGFSCSGMGRLASVARGDGVATTIRWGDSPEYAKTPIYSGIAIGQYAYTEVIVVTHNPWPTTLPGTPA